MGGDAVNAGDERLLRAWCDLKYLFGDKWAPVILVTLQGGPMRRKEILSTISSYSIGKEWSDKHVLHDSILARTLKTMTEEGLVTCTSDTMTFPHLVYYTLNPALSEYLEIAKALLPWVDAHPELIAHAQAYARRNGDGNADDGNGGGIGVIIDVAERAALDISDKVGGDSGPAEDPRVRDEFG
ncbi:DNA-binding transcriptional regulator, HxlR family [Actinokineospora alba]|uniref:DNA-binding transcriptional regulator, HxlR family n=1 Tax=Actinokineospora alba TaxID=504798 RepID=A0A1H0LCY7_9PSEU|nr:HxlR family transcriptional regulator [Actinokineospora alba]SDJ01724.1 DNA-binding transcriptional regulator, HxlR family [Actinokineospora alba]SDO66109.1 DNA-binding transcriptional regulator, HxlR family [Actinokineospora alba]